MPAAIKFAPNQIKRMVSLYEQCESLNALSAIYECSIRTIKRVLTKAGVTIRPISAADGNEAEIVGCYVAGESLELLAKRFSVDPRKIRQIVRDSGTTQRTMAEANRRRGLDESFFDVIDTEAKAYFLGYLYADGCVNDEGKTILSLQLRDLPILEEFRKQVKYEGEVRLRPNINKATLTLGSKRIAAQLVALGCTPRKTFTLQFPEWIEGEMLRHFMRGFIDGDGCFYSGKRCTYVSAVGTIAFVSRLIEKLSQLCKVNGQIAPLHGKLNGIVTGRIGGAIQVKRVADYLYQNATIYLQRKKDKADSIVPQGHIGERNPAAVLNEQSVLEIKRRLAVGEHYKDLAVEYGVSEAATHKIKRGRTWSKTTGLSLAMVAKELRLGSASSTAKLTESDIPEIRSLLAGGMKRGQIAAQYAVSEAAIRFIDKGETWSHV
jgi:Mor family transcriptional regulator